jgi:hypothetical protein
VRTIRALATCFSPTSGSISGARRSRSLSGCPCWRPRSVASGTSRPSTRRAPSSAGRTFRAFPRSSTTRPATAWLRRPSSTRRHTPSCMRHSPTCRSRSRPGSRWRSWLACCCGRSKSAGADSVSSDAVLCWARSPGVRWREPSRAVRRALSPSPLYCLRFWGSNAATAEARCSREAPLRLSLSSPNWRCR